MTAAYGERPSPMGQQVNGVLGFACHWGSSPTQTWSGSAHNLLQALRRQGAVADLDLTLSPAVRSTLRAAHARRDGHGWRSNWRHSRSGTMLVERSLRRQLRGAEVTSVLQVGDLGVVDTPYYVWQDLSFDLLLQHYGPQGVPHFRTLGRRDLERLRSRQQRVYDNAAGVLAMSQWLASSVIESGVASERVHVVHPGTNSTPRETPLPPRRQGRRRRLLFIGRDFDTKAGDQVLAAVDLLRATEGPHITLTIAGPRTWPVKGSGVPEGVRFLGPVPSTHVSALYETHDLLVMPSRFEGFGIVFAEALARGLPCIGRRACAMTEMIDERSGGRRVETDQPASLAECIMSALRDDALYESCAAAAPDRRRYFTWERAADQIRSVIAT